MKRYRVHFLVMSLLFISGLVKSQTTLTTGDIVFLGVNTADDNGMYQYDEFSFLLLKNITTNTIINFTDFGWTNNNTFQQSAPCGVNTGSYYDGIISWRASSNLSSGTEVRVLCKNMMTLYASTGTVSGVQGTTANAVEYLSLSTAGDQIFAYQGTTAAPTLLAGIMVGKAAWDASLDPCAFTSSDSRLPAALSTASVATGTNKINGKYNCTVFSGSTTTIRNAINNPTNWNTNTSTSSPTGITLPVNCAYTMSLPVTLLNFTGETVNNAALLKWNTSKETEFSHFVLERSTDGLNFSQVATVASNTQKAYSYTDNNLQAATKFYYRLKQVDKDAGFTYSKVISITSRMHQLSIDNLSNPFVSTFKCTINAPTNGQITVRLTDMQGRIVSQQSLQGSAGSNAVQFAEIAALPQGMYCLQVMQNEQQARLMLVKAK